MKKKIIISVIVVVIVAIAIACFAYINMNYPYAFYFGDRIMGTYSSHENGIYGIDVDEISCVYGGENVRVYTRDQNRFYSIKGNKYGEYNICFTINQGDICKLLATEKPDNDYKIYVSLVKNKNEFDYVNVHTEWFCENGEWYVTVTADRGAYRIEKTQKLDNSNFEIKLDFGV